MRALDPIFGATTILKTTRGSESVSSATGFFFSVKDETRYLVTNKHVIYGDDYASPGAAPQVDAVEMLLHSDANDLRINTSVCVPLVQSGEKLWKEHPEPGVDVVCVPLDLDWKKYVLTSTDERLLDASGLRIGFEKVFVMGYPLGWYDCVHNLPITRIGHLSSPFGVPFRGKPYMLGDVETHAGMSGSPVFLELQDYVTVDNNGNATTQLGQSKRILLGVFSGQPLWQKQDLETGEEVDVPHSLSVIWFGDLINEIIQA